MNKHIVADTYANFEQIGDVFQKNGKPYITVKEKCDRCWKGIFVCRVENNQPVPHPAYGGVCLKCDGKGYIEKDVRVYTEKEKAAADRAKARRAEAAAQKAKEREEEMAKKAHIFKAEAREKRGFGFETGWGYMVLGNSFDVKEEIKAADGKFNGDAIKAWIVPDNDVEFEGCRLVAVEFDKLYEMNGKFARQKDVETVKSYINSVVGTSGEFVGEVGERLRNIKVELTEAAGFEGRYGYTSIYTFVDEDGNHYKWFTGKELEKGSYILTGTVKDHSTYNFTNETVLTRCIVKGA